MLRDGANLPRLFHLRWCGFVRAMASVGRKPSADGWETGAGGCCRAILSSLPCPVNGNYRTRCPGASQGRFDMVADGVKLPRLPSYQGVSVRLSSITTTLPHFGQFLAGNRFAKGNATKLSSAWAGRHEEVLKVPFLCQGRREVGPVEKDRRAWWPWRRKNEGQ